MSKLNVPSKDLLFRHLKKYSPYGRNSSWVKWYAQVAKFKGLRTIKILSQYKKKDSKVLDLGCGIGITLSILSDYFPDSVGIDIDPKSVKAAKELLKKQNLNIPVILYDGKKIPFPKNTFDIITSIEVIEHVEDTELILKEMNRVLKPNGILHITTANKWWPFEPHYKLLLLSYLPKSIANFYVRISGRGTTYEDIELPSYDEFRNSVGEFFKVEDITFEMIEQYKKFDFDKERGYKIVLAGEFLKIMAKLEKIPIFSFFVKILKFMMIRISLGWLFIGRPKDKLT